MKIKALALLVVGCMLVCGCEIDLDGDEDQAAEREKVYITWTGSDNGEWVLDYSDEKVRFESTSKTMYAGSTECPHYTVDETYGFYHRGTRIGRVVGVESSTGGRITALWGNSDNDRIDLIGTPPDLQWKYVQRQSQSSSSVQVNYNISYDLGLPWY